MFSTKEHLEKRTGEFGVGRLEYLNQLVNELMKTKSIDSKEQILGNLANFAYDPINYDFLRKLRVIDIFLDYLSDDSVTLQQFAVTGLCNLCLVCQLTDPENQEYILHLQAVSHLKPLLFSCHEETILNTIATLMYLVTPESKPEITSSDILQQMNLLAQHSDRRISNLATIFLTDLTN